MRRRKPMSVVPPPLIKLTESTKKVRARGLDELVARMAEDLKKGRLLVKSTADGV